MALISWWASWWRNLFKADSLGRRAPGPGDHATESTVDYPTAAAVPPVPAAASGAQVAGPWTLRFGVVSEVGTFRRLNEDNYFVPGRTLEMGPAAADRRLAGPDGLFLVADGMGGQQAGEKASLMAVEHIPEELLKRLDGGPDAAPPDERTVLRALRDAIAYANQEILSLSSVETEFSNMGTTVVLALFQGGKVYITGIGDSRAYRLRDDRLEQLTRDHSLADALGEAGTIARDEVSTHRFKNVLYLYLGSKDARSGPEEVRVLDLRAGDRFLLASDGLTGVVDDDRLAAQLAAHADPQHAAQALVREALENLSKDNITCLVIHVDAT